MKLCEITQKANTASGTYVAATMDKESKNKIKDLCISMGIPNRIKREKMHTTIIYSRKHVPELEVNESMYPLEASSLELETFNTQDDKKALVLKIKSKKLVDRHNSLMAKYDLTYDFPEYIPHITLSYDIGDFDVSAYEGDLPDSLIFMTEYVEDLVLDWQNK